MNKICIITGATDGIGKQTVFELAKQGFILGLVGRNRQKGETVISEIQAETNNESMTFFEADLSLVHQVKSVAQDIRNTYDSIDVLLNNAGAYCSEFSQTEEGFETTFALNHLNYFVLTHELLDMVKEAQSGRVVNVASMAHKNATLDYDDLQMTKSYSGWTSYCRSKLMNIMFTYECHRRYTDTGITFNCLHPGFVNTNFGDNNSGIARQSINIAKTLFAINVEKGARTSVYLASSEDVSGVTGKYFDKCKTVKSSKTSYIGDDQEYLWDSTETLISSKVNIN